MKEKNMSNSIKTRSLRAEIGGNSGLKGLWPALSALNEGEVSFLTARTQDEFWNMEYENRFSKHVHGGLFSPASVRGRELWQKYWHLIEADWIKKYPGRRPLAYWFHGVADAGTADYFDLRERSMWSKSKQREYLEKHGLLRPGE